MFKRNRFTAFCGMAVFCLILTACGSPAATAPAQSTATSILLTDTPVPPTPLDTAMPPIVTPTVFATTPALPTVTPSRSTSTPDLMPADASQLSITYTCNDGFILASSGRKILVDVLFPEGALRCANAAGDAASMRQARPPFDGADLVLVTHAHPDHFDAQLLGEYMLNNPRAIVVTTEEAVSLLETSFADFTRIQDRLRSVKLEVSESEQMTVEGIELEVIVSSPDMHSLGFVIHLGDYTLFHPGDLNDSLDIATYLDAFGLPDMNIDIAFLQYWLLGNLQFLPILDEIDAQYYIPMHFTPSWGQEDAFAMVSVNYPKAIMFGEEMQTVIFPLDLPQSLSGSGGGVIAFTSERDGNMEIYIMNADGSDQRRLTSNRQNDGWASWSPTGMCIAYHTVRTSGSSLRGMNIYNNISWQWDISLEGNLWEPAWSHDDQWIAFSNQRTNSESDIYVLSVDGEHLFRLTNTAGFDGGPFWSPDDQQIAFYSNRDGNFEVYVMQADGLDERRLTDNPAEDLVTAWSPDGARLAFFSNRDGNYELYTINADGSGLTQLTDTPSDEMYPTWSPDGTQIAFTSDRDGNFEIYVATVPEPGSLIDGASVRRLTNTSAQELGPVWMPVP